MEDENTVTYFLFNDRKSTLRCSFILSYSHTFFELYSCFICISPLLYLQHNTIPFYLLPFSFHFILILQQLLPLFVSFLPSYILIFSLISIKKLLHFNFIPPHLEHGSNLFNLHSRPLSLSNYLHFPPVSLLLFLNKNSFATPPQSLCTKGMVTLSCKSNDIAPQKQCNYQ